MGAANIFYFSVLAIATTVFVAMRFLLRRISPTEMTNFQNVENIKAIHNLNLGPNAFTDYDAAGMLTIGGISLAAAFLPAAACESGNTASFVGMTLLSFTIFVLAPFYGSLRRENTSFLRPFANTIGFASAYLTGMVQSVKRNGIFAKQNESKDQRAVDIQQRNPSLTKDFASALADLLFQGDHLINEAPSHPHAFAQYWTNLRTSGLISQDASGNDMVDLYNIAVFKAHVGLLCWLLLLIMLAGLSVFTYIATKCRMKTRGDDDMAAEREARVANM